MEVERMTLHQVGMVTICKIESYIPIVGTVIGAARLYGMATAQRHAEGEVDSRALAVFHGVVETLSLGPLLIIPDVITTCARSHWAQAQRAAAAHPAMPPA